MRRLIDWLRTPRRKRRHRYIEIDVYGARQRILRYGLAAMLRASILQR